jgi:hypothetical protein
MRTLEQRMIRLTAEVPARPTKEPQRGETASTVHFCLERSDGTLLLIERGMPAFTPPADDSTVVVIRLKPKRR